MNSVWFEAFNSEQDLVFSSLENNPIMLPRLLMLPRLEKTTKKIFHSSVSTSDMDKVGSI